jgi:hypothetical protein
VYDENMLPRTTAHTSKETEITALSNSSPKITSNQTKVQDELEVRFALIYFKELITLS